MSPRPPARLTAAANRPPAATAIGAEITGCAIPSVRVRRVGMIAVISSSPWPGLDSTRGHVRMDAGLIDLTVASWFHPATATSADADDCPSTEPKVRGSNPLGRATSLHCGIVREAADRRTLPAFRARSAREV